MLETLGNSVLLCHYSWFHYFRKLFSEIWFHIDFICPFPNLTFNVIGCSLAAFEDEELDSMLQQALHSLGKEDIEALRAFQTHQELDDDHLDHPIPGDFL